MRHQPAILRPVSLLVTVLQLRLWLREDVYGVSWVPHSVWHNRSHHDGLHGPPSKSKRCLSASNYRPKASTLVCFAAICRVQARLGTRVYTLEVWYDSGQEAADLLKGGVRPVIPESQDGASRARRDVFRRSSWFEYLNLQAVRTRWACDAKTPTSTWCSVQAQPRVSVEEALAINFPAWPDAHRMRQGNGAVHPCSNVFIHHKNDVFNVLLLSICAVPTH